MTKGMVRSVDNLGRIVIPKEYRKMLGITSKDKLEISINEDTIEIKKYDLDDRFLKVQNLYFNALNSIYPGKVFFCTLDAIYLYDKKKRIKNEELFKKLPLINNLKYIDEKLILNNKILSGYFLVSVEFGEEIIGYIVIGADRDEMDKMQFIYKLVNS